MSDRLSLRGITAFGRHGVLPAERADGQHFVVDLVLGLDARPAASRDELSSTVDYGQLAEQVHAAVESEPVDLIETLAERVARLCLLESAVEWVEVTVHKPAAPVSVPVDDVALTIHRSRG